MKEQLIVKGARQHNLKNITVEIPRDELVVVTGLSAAVNLLWHLILSMRKGSVVMSNRCPLMRVNF